MLPTTHTTPVFIATDAAMLSACIGLHLRAQAAEQRADAAERQIKHRHLECLLHDCTLAPLPGGVWCNLHQNLPAPSGDILDYYTDVRAGRGRGWTRSPMQDDGAVGDDQP